MEEGYVNVVLVDSEVEEAPAVPQRSPEVSEEPYVLAAPPHANDMTSRFRRAASESERWEEFSKSLSLQNAALQRTLGERNEFCGWLASEVLKAQQATTDVRGELEQAEAVSAIRARDRLHLNQALDRNIADYRELFRQHQALEAKHKALKLQHAATVKRSKRLRELEKLTDHNRYVRPAAASARKKMQKQK